MLKSSLNAKLLVIVFIAVFALAASVITLGTKASLRQLHTSHESSQLVISELVASTLAGNIKYGKTENLDAEFAKYSSHEHLDIAYIAAVKPDGTLLSVITENESLESVALEYAAKSISESSSQSFEFETYYVVAAPAIFGKNASVVGTVVTIWDLNSSLATARTNAINNSLVAGLVAFAALLAMSIVLRRVVISPIRDMTQAAGRVADGHLDQPIKDTDRKDELGRLARTIAVSRENAIKIAEFDDERKAADETSKAERASMMHDLQTAFGDAIKAASAGDFSKRVACDFPDDELNLLAEGLNSLIEKVEKGLDETGRVLAAIANTDLTKRIDGTYSGAFERLKNDTNAVADKFTEIIGQLKTTSDGLKVATDEMHSGSSDLSDRTSQQAAEIEETSGSMNRISIAINDNAEQAETARSIVNQVSQNAHEGAKVMKDVQTAMASINQSSNKISDIIGLIDNVAFQTNLLALNASVEAARAGESGKGFAVVAEEVRRLAQTAATASSDVNVLIDESTFEVKKGTELVVDAANKIAQMVDAAEKNSVIISSIANECREQATVIEEVNAAVGRMDKMTQNNASLVEETNASIEQTKNDAQTLDRIVELFQLNPSTKPQISKKKMIKELEDDLRDDQEAAIEIRTDQTPTNPKPTSELKTAANQDWSEF